MKITEKLSDVDTDAGPRKLPRNAGSRPFSTKIAGFARIASENEPGAQYNPRSVSLGAFENTQ